jgi:hypothetical protein
LKLPSAFSKRGVLIGARMIAHRAAVRVDEHRDAKRGANARRALAPDRNGFVTAVAPGRGMDARFS